MKTYTIKADSISDAFNQLEPGFIDYSDLTRIYNKSEFTDPEEFAKDYFKDVSRPYEGEAYLIIIKEPKPQKPTKLKVINHVTQEPRKWRTMINFIDEMGKTVFTCPTKELKKADAIRQAKEYALKHNTSIDIVLSKEIVKSGDVIAQIVPKEDTNYHGVYFFFGIPSTSDSDQ